MAPTSAQNVTHAYIGVMARPTDTRVHGSTAIAEDTGHRHPVHPVGDALRAVRVFVTTTFRVVVMGQDGAAARD